MKHNDTGQLTLFDAPGEKIQDSSEPKNVSKQSSTWIIHVDGASRGNPGPSGAGIYIYNKTEEKVIAKEGFFLGNKTNNQAEYLALVLAGILLQDLVKQNDQPAPLVHIVSDSLLLVRQMQGVYRVKHPTLLEIKNVAARLFSGVKHNFKHVLREYNKDADLLANQGVDRKRMVPLSLRGQLKNINLSLP